MGTLGGVLYAINAVDEIERWRFRTCTVLRARTNGGSYVVPVRERRTVFFTVSTASLISQDDRIAR